MGLFDSVKQALSLKPSQKSAKEQLEELYSKCEQCNGCSLAGSRLKVIKGYGNPSQGKILFITGKPLHREEQDFLAKAMAGQKMFPERDYYVTNIVKCFVNIPKALPEMEAIEACAPILKREIEIIRPSLVVALGLETAKLLAGNKDPLPPSLRGKFVTAKHSSPVFPAGAKIFNTFYPAYVMKNPKTMLTFKEDIVKIKSMYEFEKARGQS